MKRYLLFYGENCYPCGGWDDFRGQFDTINEAINSVPTPNEMDWAEIVDTYTGSKIKQLSLWVERKDGTNFYWKDLDET